MMNNTFTKTLSDLPEYEQEFAKAIIDIVESRHKMYVRDRNNLGEDIPLENIHFGVENFENNIGIPILQEIAKRRGNHSGKLEGTARHMLGVYCRIGEIEPDQGSYTLTKHGELYKRLGKKLASTL